MAIRPGGFSVGLSCPWRGTLRREGICAPTPGPGRRTGQEANEYFADVQAAPFRHITLGAAIEGASARGTFGVRAGQRPEDCDPRLLPGLPRGRARAIAERAHRGQVEPSGRPYIDHVRRVAAAVPPEMASVAWLHDVLEWTDVGEEDLVAAGLAPEERAALRLLTRPDEPDDESFLSHVRVIALTPGPAGDIARVVKRADMEDRLRHPRDPGGAWIPPYRRALEILRAGPGRQGHAPEGRRRADSALAARPTTRRESRHDDHHARRPPRPDQGHGWSTSPWPSGWPAARPRAPTCPARPTPSSTPARSARTRSPCSSARPTTRVPELVPIRYGRMLVSPFTFYRGAALIMAATWPPRRPPACASSSAATPTCRTSASSAPPSGAWSSTSTTSTRPCRDRSSGTSSGWRPASRWPAATGASPTPTARRSCSGLRAHLPRPRWPSSPGRRNLEVFYARLDVDEMFARYQATVPAQAGQARREGPGQGAHQGQHAGPRQADPRGGRRAAHHAPTRR